MNFDFNNMDFGDWRYEGPTDADFLQNIGQGVQVGNPFFDNVTSTPAPQEPSNNQQQQVLALLLYYHYQYKKDITNNKVLWKILFDYDTKIKIKEDPIFEKGLSDSALQNILTSLRKKKIIVNGEISGLYVPELSINSKNFKIIFIFNIVNNE